MSEEINKIVNMSALAISQLFQNAQDQGLPLELDTAKIENLV